MEHTSKTGLGERTDSHWENITKTMGQLDAFSDGLISIRDGIVCVPGWDVEPRVERIAVELSLGYLEK